MIKPRFPLRFNATALLIVGGATFLVSGRAFAAPASAKKPAKTTAPQTKTEVRAPANYPRDANGFWDWKNSPDIKSGVVDPRLVEFYTLQQKMRADLLNIASGHEGLRDSDMFIVDNKAARSSDKDLFGTEYGFDYAIGWYMNQKYTPDIPMPKKGSTRYTIANLAAKALIDNRARDLNMKLLLANTLENQVRALTFSATYNQRDSYFLDARSPENIWIEILNKVHLYRGEYWKDDSYDGAKKIQMAKSTLNNLNEFPNLDSYISWLKAYKNPITDKKADAFMAALKLLKSSNQ